MQMHSREPRNVFLNRLRTGSSTESTMNDREPIDECQRGGIVVASNVAILTDDHGHDGPELHHGRERTARTGKMIFPSKRDTIWCGKIIDAEFGKRDA